MTTFINHVRSLCAKDMAERLAIDVELRREVASRYFASLSEDNVKQAALDAGILPIRSKPLRRAALRG